MAFLLLPEFGRGVDGFGRTGVPYLAATARGPSFPLKLHGRGPRTRVGVRPRRDSVNWWHSAGDHGTIAAARVKLRSPIVISLLLGEE